MEKKRRILGYIAFGIAVMLLVSALTAAITKAQNSQTESPSSGTSEPEQPTALQCGNILCESGETSQNCQSDCVTSVIVPFGKILSDYASVELFTAGAQTQLKAYV